MGSKRRSSVVLALGLVACSSAREASPLPPVAADAFASAYADATCRRFARCNPATPAVVDACRADVLARFRDDVPKAIAAGRVVYDPALAAQCIASTEAADCRAESVPFDVETACFDALRGTLDPGAPCAFTYDCKAGYCGGDGMTCPAVCPHVLGEGEACVGFNGPACDARAHLRCSGNVCVRPRGRDASCADNFGCDTGLVCVAGKCVPLRRENEACGADTSCEPGLFCEGGGGDSDEPAGGPATACKPRLTGGAPCAAAADELRAAFAGVQCAEGLVCKGATITATGQLLAGACAPAAAEHASCTAEPPGAQLFVSGCETGLYCLDGACTPLPTTGPCAPGRKCLPVAAYCDQDGNCRSRKAFGEACVLDEECVTHRCANATCASLPPVCHEP